MAEQKDQFLNEARTKELWAAIKTHVTQKITDELDDYATTEAVATAIVTALQDYPDNAELAETITKALTDYMTKSEVNDAILAAVGEATKLGKKVVASLPSEGEDDIIYLVPASDPTDQNVKDEYMWIEGKWEKIGRTSVELTNYWSKEELEPMSQEALAAILV